MQTQPFVKPVSNPLSVQIINDIDCKFQVYRKRTSDHVISIALWKKSSGYVFNLSTSILWWLQNGELFFPGWNIRFYIDSSLINRKIDNDINWQSLIERMKLHQNVEIWEGYCPWGDPLPDKQTDCQNCHINTFNSLLRFHASTDPSVLISVIKNVELLTSPKESRLIHDWVRSNKKYYISCDPNYICNYTTEDEKTLCNGLGLQNELMIIAASFGTRGTILDKKSTPEPEPESEYNYFYMVRKYINNQKLDYPISSTKLDDPILSSLRQLRQYIYGVDEIVLTKIVKPLMNDDNTYTILREKFGQWLPLENPHYKFFLKQFKPAIDQVLTGLNDKDKEMLNNLFSSVNLPDFTYKSGSNEYQITNLIKDIISSSIKIEDNMPDILVKILNIIKNNVMGELERKINSKEIQDQLETNFNLMQDYYFTRFLKNDSGKENEKNFFFFKATNESEAKILFILGLKTILFEILDWPGYCVKNKDGIKCYPVMNITEEQIKKRIAVRVKNRKFNKLLQTGKTPEEEEKMVICILQNEYGSKKNTHDMNTERFKRNLNRLLFASTEEPYEVKCITQQISEPLPKE
jgi:hypothetical protein